jgi:hypothetical protein
VNRGESDKDLPRRFVKALQVLSELTRLCVLSQCLPMQSQVAPELAPQAGTLEGDFHDMFTQIWGVWQTIVKKFANVFSRSVAQSGSASVWGTDIHHHNPLKFHHNPFVLSPLLTPTSLQVVQNNLVSG